MIFLFLKLYLKNYTSCRCCQEVFSNYFKSHININIAVDHSDVCHSDCALLLNSVSFSILVISLVVFIDITIMIVQYLICINSYFLFFLSTFSQYILSSSVRLDRHVEHALVRSILFKPIYTMICMNLICIACFSNVL